MSVRRLGYEEEDFLDAAVDPEAVSLYEPTLEAVAIPEPAPRVTREVVFMVSFLALVAIFIAFL